MVKIGQALLPDVDFTKDWGTQLPWPIVEPPTLERVTDALNDITTVSAMLQEKGADLNALETLQVENHLRRINNAMLWLGEAFATYPSVANAMAGQVIAACFQRLKSELDRPLSEEPLAIEFGHMLKGDFTELTAQVTGLRIALMEHALGLEVWSGLAGPVEEVSTN